MSPFAVILWCLNALALIHVCLSACYRIPQGATGDRSPVDENYQILIDGNPSTYLPGREYNLSLSCPEGLKFTSFTLLVESVDPELNSRSELLGKFEIIDPAETKFSNLCENMIESSNNNIKRRINVKWVAPDDPESDCVLFKAAVLQHRFVWFIDDGYLTKKICRESVDEANSQLPPVDPCCACDEAKYEIVLERNWTRNTHPKNFPLEAWRTSFGTVIGASHSVDYKFWSYGMAASQGLKELAEHGSSTTLEMEIKNQSETGSIRTIIKAPGIKFKANAVGRTLATVRVGPTHHMISLVSKINPSPDWILGIASMELCTENCRWIEGKVINLYPWDAGTDSGPTYMSPDQAQIPADVVRRITSTFPSDENSPFYDKSGAPMKPLGTLRVTRKRTYGRCYDETQQETPIECDTHPWADWSECNVKCGSGTQYRLRDYKDPELARKKNCQEILRQTQDCSGSCYDGTIGLPPSDNNRYSSAECELTPWSAFSECSNNCGTGWKTRTRGYVNPSAMVECQSAGIPAELTQTKSCEGTYCGGNIPIPPARRMNDRNKFSSSVADYDTDPSARQSSGIEYDYGDGVSGSIESSDLRTQITKPPPTRYNDFGNVNTIYGSERLRGNPSNNYDDNSKSFTGDLESFNENNNRNSGQTNSWSAKQYAKQNMRVTTTTQRPFRSSGYGPSRSGSGRLTSSLAFERYDPFTIKTIDEDGEDFQVDKSFCLSKPVASFEPCGAARVIIKNYWFYDAFDMQCKLFTSDNCDQNRNKFAKLEECEAQCDGVGFNNGGGLGNAEGFANMGGFSNSGGFGNGGGSFNNAGVVGKGGVFGNTGGFGNRGG